MAKTAVSHWPRSRVSSVVTPGLQGAGARGCAPCTVGLVFTVGVVSAAIPAPPSGGSSPYSVLSGDFLGHQFREFNVDADRGATSALRGNPDRFLSSGRAGIMKHVRSGYFDMFQLEFDGGCISTDAGPQAASSCRGAALGGLVGEPRRQGAAELSSASSPFIYTTISL